MRGVHHDKELNQELDSSADMPNNLSQACFAGRKERVFRCSKCLQRITEFVLFGLKLESEHLWGLIEKEFCTDRRAIEEKKRSKKERLSKLIKVIRFCEKGLHTHLCRVGGERLTLMKSNMRALRRPSSFCHLYPCRRLTELKTLPYGAACPVSKDKARAGITRKICPFVWNIFIIFQ